MKFVLRVKPFDVLIINKTENMTSVDCITQLVDESEVNRKKGDPQLRKEPSTEESCRPGRQSAKTISKPVLPFVLIKTLCRFRSLIYHSIFVLLLIFRF